MTTELQMLVWVTVLTLVMWLPYILAKLAKDGVLETLNYTTDNNPLPSWAMRAKKAHYNAIENFSIFAALIMVAHLANISNDATISAAVAYFWFRLAHYILYVSNIPFGRTLAFAGSWFAQICIVYQLLVAFPL
jgi:uncharacterized MAPEG superfamily protein